MTVVYECNTCHNKNNNAKCFTCNSFNNYKPSSLDKDTVNDTCSKCTADYCNFCISYDAFQLSTEPTPIEQFDAVHHVKHYQLFGGEKQVKDLIEDRLKQLAASAAFQKLPLEKQLLVAAYYKDVIKYSMRWMVKDGFQDLDKCTTYIKFIREIYED